MKKIVSLFLIMLLLLASTVNAFAAGTVYLGSNNVYYAGGYVNYNIAGYVSYNDNQSTYLDLDSLTQWIYNYGTESVIEVEFRAHDGNFTNDTTSAYGITPITTGNNRRIEEVWSSVTSNTVYYKNSLANMCRTMIFSGCSYYQLGGWETWWYANSRTNYFNN